MEDRIGRRPRSVVSPLHPHVVVVMTSTAREYSGLFDDHHHRAMSVARKRRKSSPVPIQGSDAALARLRANSGAPVALQVAWPLTPARRALTTPPQTAMLTCTSRGAYPRFWEAVGTPHV